MNKKSNFKITKSISNFFARFNAIIFLIVIVVGLSLAVIAVSNTIKSTYDEKNYSDSSSSIKFDENTINRLKQFHQSDKNPNTNLISIDRSSLFAE